MLDNPWDDQVVVWKWQAEAIVVASRLTEFSPENTPSKSRVRRGARKKTTLREMCPWGVVTYASRQLITMGFSAWRAIAFRFEIGDEIRIDSLEEKIFKFRIFYSKVY